MQEQVHGNIEQNIRDARKINCQVCLKVSSINENVGNMHNIQQEKNIELGML